MFQIWTKHRQAPQMPRVRFINDDHFFGLWGHVAFGVNVLIGVERA